MSTTHDLTGAYLMGALESAELAEFEQHLSDCSACRDEVASLSGVIEQLGADSAEAAPASLQTAVMAAVAATPQEHATRPDATQEPPTQSKAEPGIAPVTSLGAARERKQRQFLVGRPGFLGAAAAVIVAVVLAVGAYLSFAPSLTVAETVVAAADAQTHSLGFGTAELVVSAEAGGYAIQGGAPALDPGRAYQLWFVTEEGDVRPGPTFAPGDDGTLDAAELRPLDGIVAFAVSVEPAAGSEQPTTDPIALAEL